MAVCVDPFILPSKSITLCCYCHYWNNADECPGHFVAGSTYWESSSPSSLVLVGIQSPPNQLNLLCKKQAKLMDGKWGRKKHICTNSCLACFLSFWICRHFWLFKLFFRLMEFIETVKSLTLKVSCHPSISRKKNRGNNVPKVTQRDINEIGTAWVWNTQRILVYKNKYLYFNLYAFLWSSQVSFEASISGSRNAPLKKSSGLKSHFSALHWKERRSSCFPRLLNNENVIPQSPGL